MRNQDVNLSMTNVRGMSRDSGLSLDQTDHILQSLRDILTTPIGSRVMRREYGSLLPFVIDAPLNSFLLMQVRAAVIHALMRWEYRVTPVRVELTVASASQAMHGVATLMIEYKFTASQKVQRAYLALGGAL